MSDKVSAKHREKAQDLAWQAMDASDFKIALELCRQALALDPRCVDALVGVAAMDSDDNQRLAGLEAAVRIAAEDLGGDAYFEENEGYFWGLVETRPYMRARALLAEVLDELGRTLDAIAEYEALMRLNPNDNQGLRYRLIGLYLETGGLRSARRLLEEYGDDDSAMFTWAAVIESWLSNDLDGASHALAVAREANSYVEDYLLGRRPLPEELPTYYGVGDLNEAVICMLTVGRAWAANQQAINWLASQPAAPLAISFNEAGRNDPCPCGSGKKYKKCCYGKPVAEPAPSPGRAGPPSLGRGEHERMMRDLTAAIAREGIETEEEMDAFIQQYNASLDQEQPADFSGLIPEQVRELLEFPFDSPGLLEFPKQLDCEPVAPVITLIQALAEVIGEDGLKLTQKGNLKRDVTQRIALDYWGEEKYEKYTKIIKLHREYAFSDLRVTRELAMAAGLMRKYRGKLVLTKKYHQLLKQGGLAAVYPLLFETFIWEIDWGGSLRDDEGFVQQSFAFTLYLLQRLGGEWRASTEYADAYYRAFPRQLDTSWLRDEYSQELYYKMMSSSYSYFALVRFANFMGLAELRDYDLLGFHEEFQLRKTPLFDAVVKFHVDPVT